MLPFVGSVKSNSHYTSVSCSRSNELLQSLLCVSCDDMLYRIYAICSITVEDNKEPNA